MRRKKKEKREEINRKMEETGQQAAMRGDPGYISSSSASDTSRSSVSYGGVNEQDLEHLIDTEKTKEIHERREKRRYNKWSTAFNKVVTTSVTAEIASAIYSDNGQFDLQTMEAAMERQQAMQNFPIEQKQALADLG